ncbi:MULTISPECIES: MFS transporter [Natrialbaceae]|uniref:MFS transporter n=1 Tax=Natrialbaceae TaxID=1644061 RepID=UPI00207C33BB|nr:MFS transporter [Natronococcus sp. CG52]
MNRNVRETLIGGLFVFVVTYLLFVPGDPLWGILSDRVGELGMILGIIGICAACGAAFAALAGVRLQFLLAGGAAVYTLWLIYLEAAAGPFDSPVHLYIGAFLLTGFALGAGLVEKARRHDVL